MEKLACTTIGPCAPNHPPRRPELIEQRRWELEQWLWRLTESPQVGAATACGSESPQHIVLPSGSPRLAQGRFVHRFCRFPVACPDRQTCTCHPQIANSLMMFHFCELDAAARMRPRAASAGPPGAGGSALDGGASERASQLGSPLGSLGAAAAGGSTQLSPMHSYAPSWSGSEASDLFPGSSTSSLAAAAAAAAVAGSASTLSDSPARQPSQQQHHHQHTPPRPQHAQQLHASAHSDSHSDGGRHQPLAAAGMLPASAGLGALGGGGQLRLALPVQHRGAAKAAARLLREQLATAQADLQGEPAAAGLAAPFAQSPAVACSHYIAWRVTPHIFHLPRCCDLQTLPARLPATSRPWPSWQLSWRRCRSSSSWQLSWGREMAPARRRQAWRRQRRQRSSRRQRRWRRSRRRQPRWRSCSST